MDALACIFLCNLKLHHHLRLLQTEEQRRYGLTWLEVDGAVLDLDDDVVGKLSIEVDELFVGLVGTVTLVGKLSRSLLCVVRTLGRIDKSAPHDDAAIGLEGSSQHVGSIHMGAAIVHGTRLTLAVGLDQEAAEIGNEPIDFLGLLLPPLLHLGVERVGRGEIAQSLGRSEVDGEVNLDAVRT